MTVLLAVVLPPVLVLAFLIFRINNGEHFTPQAYYRRKRTGAPVAYGVDALGPRRRRRLPEEMVGGPVHAGAEATTTPVEE